MNDAVPPAAGIVETMTPETALRSEILDRTSSVLIRVAIAFALCGLLACLPLLIRETPYTFVLFMFLAQPLLVIGFLLYAVKVFRDLRSGKLL